MDFRVATSSAIMLNITLDPPRSSPCFIVGPAYDPASPEWHDMVKDLCGGEDSYTTPDTGGGTLDVYIRFGSRRRTGGSSAYEGWNGPQGSEPASVTYNLLTLTADYLAYYRDNGTLRASGCVHLVYETGATVLAESMTVKVEHGQLIPLH